MRIITPQWCRWLAGVRLGLLLAAMATISAAVPSQSQDYYPFSSKR